MVSMKDGVGIQNRIMSDELDGAVLVTEVRRDYSSHLLGNQSMVVIIIIYRYYFWLHRKLFTTHNYDTFDAVFDSHTFTIC